MSIGAGIAIAGIWLGVGIVGLKDTQGWSVMVALLAMIATLMVVAVSK